MTQGNNGLNLSNCNIHPNMDVNAVNDIQYLKEQLIKYQTENKRLADQLNCLTSLIKRSWNGDQHATIHLSNIIGNTGSVARPNSQAYSTTSAKARCEHDWKRPIIEQDAVQNEIKVQQKIYIEDRQAYMDAVLQDHYKSMSRLPLHRKTDPSQVQALDEVDKRIFRHIKRMKMTIGSGRQKARSAGITRTASLSEVVESAKVSLRDLVTEGPPASDDPVAANTFSEPHTVTPSAHRKGRPLSAVTHHRSHTCDSYNDPARYIQNNLFRPKECDDVKWPHPVSTSSLRRGDIQRSKPRSGHDRKTVIDNRKTANDDRSMETPTYIAEINERPLKYETTRPLSAASPKSGKQLSTLLRDPRKRSTNSATNKPAVTKEDNRDGTNQPTQRKRDNSCDGTYQLSQGKGGNSNGGTNEMESLHSASTFGDSSQGHDRKGKDIYNVSDSEEDFRMPSKPPPALRVKSAFTCRPACVDEFVKDEKAMRDIEEDFRRTALTLQRKLGIGDAGIVTFD